MAAVNLPLDAERGRRGDASCRARARSRSVASAIEAAGGYPEWLDIGEDMWVNHRWRELGLDMRVRARGRRALAAAPDPRRDVASSTSATRAATPSPACIPNGTRCASPCTAGSARRSLAPPLPALLRRSPAPPRTREPRSGARGARRRPRASARPRVSFRRSWPGSTPRRWPATPPASPTAPAVRPRRRPAGVPRRLHVSAGPHRHAGHHPGSFEIGHEIRDGRRFDIDDLPVEETVDLAVVGAGISGLAAAWFYRRRRPTTRSCCSTTTTTSADTRSATSSTWTAGCSWATAAARRCSRRTPCTATWRPASCARSASTSSGSSAFDRDLYPSLGLSRGVFFTREAFGTTGSSPATRCAWSPTTSRPTA